jgi:CDP-diacylglycerol--serine O-phosphatidyltransferase
MKFQLQRRVDDKGRSRRMSKGAYLLPSFFTMLNIALGFYALYQVFRGGISEPWHYDNAAKAIGLAAVTDGLDGRIARMTNTTSDFGREFDSLADVITFGVAPAFLALVWGFHQLGPLNGSGLYPRIVQLGAFGSFAFLIAGASRLARFNIQVNPQPSNPGRPGRKYFVGMPIPAGAGVIAAVVHLTNGYPITTWWMASIWAALVLALAFLMVSTWRFYSFKDLDFRSRHPVRVTLLIGLFIAGVLLYSEHVLFFLALCYMLSGVFTRLMFLLRRSGPSVPPPPSTEAAQSQ